MEDKDKMSQYITDMLKAKQKLEERQLDERLNNSKKQSNK